MIFVDLIIIKEFARKHSMCMYVTELLISDGHALFDKLS